jgi:hypothetical protein
MKWSVLLKFKKVAATFLWDPVHYPVYKTKHLVAYLRELMAVLSSFL